MHGLALIFNHIYRVVLMSERIFDLC